MGSAPSVITERASGARLQLGGDRHHRGSVAGWGAAGGGAEGRRGDEAGQGSSPEGPGDGTRAGRRPRTTWTSGQVREPQLTRPQGTPRPPRDSTFTPETHPFRASRGFSAAPRARESAPASRLPPGSCDPGPSL